MGEREEGGSVREGGREGGGRECEGEREEGGSVREGGREGGEGECEGGWERGRREGV